MQNNVLEFLLHLGPTWNVTVNLFSIIIQNGPGHTI